jgi:acyl transferase domain-containing protein
MGAVDLFGDVRSVITSNPTRRFTKAREIRPFDSSADGSLPGEGAAALVLKRLDRAIADNDRVYAIIKGIGCAGGGRIDIDSPSKAAYILSLTRSFEESGISPDAISFIETHGSGNPVEDRVESEALQAFFAQRRTPCAIGSSKPNIGHTGAAAGLASLIKTSLCLYQEIIPPLPNFGKPTNQAWKSSLFHVPVLPQYWLRNRKEGPRRACSSAMTTDGNCMHVILEAFEHESVERIPIKVTHERKQPLGLSSAGLFAVEGNSKNDLMKGLDALALHVKNTARIDSNPHFSHIEKVSSNDEKIEIAARTWYADNRPDAEEKLAVSIVAGNIPHLKKSITEAQRAISTDTAKNMNGPGRISYSPSPMGTNGDVAFVFPGSGNHYIGMGRRIGVQWPEILRKMDAETFHLMTQFVPGFPGGCPGHPDGKQKPAKQSYPIR